MDGWITIGTELSTDKFDKQIVGLEKKIKKEEEKKMLIEAKLDSQTQELEQARQKTDELADAYQRLKTAQDAVSSGKATVSQFTTVQELQSTYGTLVQIDDSFNKALNKQDAIALKVENTRSKYEQINNTVAEYKNKIENVKLQRQQADVGKLRGSFNNVGSAVQNATKKIGRLVLGIFGIRSALSLLRSASSQLAGYDEQYAANLEYIKFVLTQAIAPVLKTIVSWAMQLLQIINGVLQALFGVNLFANASVEDFAKMKANASGVGKAVKEIKKQLLGFDEINVLTDQSDTGTAAGAGGVGTILPSFDIEEEPVWQDALQWILDNKDELIAAIEGIFAALLGLKFGFGGKTAVGMGLLVGGAVYGLEGLKGFLEDPSFKNMGETFQGIGSAIAGIGTIIGSVATGAVGAVILFYATIIKYWNEIRTFLQEKIDWLAGLSEDVRENFGDFWGYIYDVFVGNLQSILDWFDNLFSYIRYVFQNVVDFFQNVFAGDWDKAWQSLQNIGMATIAFFQRAFGILWEYIYNNVVKPIADAFEAVWNGLRDGAIGAWEGIKETFSSVGRWFGDIFSDAWQTVLNVFSSGGSIFLGIKDAIVNAFIPIVNSLITGINNVIAIPFNHINWVLNNLRNIDIMGFMPFSWLGSIGVPKIPYLKTGAIINMPNKGAYVGGGSALAGEAGREGIVPLTDAQAMSELGREIGKNVIVNLTNITSMNGRTISRELKTIQNEQEFAYNA